MPALKVPRKVTVLVDSNEQLPVPFPENVKFWHARARVPRLIQVKTRTTRLDAGDYALEGHEHVSLMETKRSVRELQGNLFTQDYRRACNAFQRLSSSCTFPYLVLEVAPWEILRPSNHVSQPDRVFDALCWVVNRYGLRLWFTGASRAQSARRALGEQMVHVMLAHALYDEEGEDQEAIMNVIRHIEERPQNDPQG